MNPSLDPAPEPRLSPEESLFFQCLELQPGARDALLEVAEPALSARVRRLLGLHERASEGEIELPRPEIAAVPEQIGPYRILERLGTGGMGEVYLALQQQPLRRLVAIKLLKPGALSPALQARFTAESQVLALMQHPGIARVLDAGQLAPGQPWFAMDRVEGEAIVDWCNQAGLDIDQRLALFLAVCDAVQHAHQKGVIHRDLKPANILVTRVDGRPQPVIIDFGVAKAGIGPGEIAAEQTVVGTIMGTPDYMSPEQAGLGRGDVDTRSDVWSLGAVLYELLVDSTPFRFAQRAATLSEVQRSLHEDEIERPSQRARQLAGEALAQRGGISANTLSRRLRGELDWIVQRALAPRRQQRYESAAALAADLRRYRSGEAVQAHPPSLGYQLGKLMRRHALATSLAAIAVVGLGLVAILMTQHAQALRIERDRTVQESARANEVTRFVSSLFDAANPRSGGASEVSALAALEQAIDRLQRDPAEDPLVQAALLATAARMLIGLGEAGRALGLAESAVELLGERGSALEVAEAHGVLGAALRDRGELKRAETHQRIARAAFAQAEDADPGRRAALSMALAENLSQQGRGEAALPILEEATQLLLSAGLEDTPRYATAQVLSSRLLRQQGRFIEAEAALQSAVALLSSQTETPPERTASALSALGLLQLDLGRAQTALAIFEQLYEDLVDRYGGAHPDTLLVANNLGLAMIQNEQFDAARALLDSARSGLISIHGEDHLVVHQISVNLAQAEHALGLAVEAEQRLASAIAGLERRLGAQHLNVAVARHHLAGVQLGQGRVDEAAALIESAWSVVSEELPANHPRRLQLAARRAEVLLRQGQSATAAEFLTANLAAADGGLPEDHPDLQRLGSLSTSISSESR